MYKFFILTYILFIANDLFSQSEKPLTNSFEYEGCGCGGNIDLRIYNGLYGSYGGQLIPEENETTTGAVTVANLNDTDGDGVIDNVDNDVIATSVGRNEVDLMRLTVSMSGEFPPSCTTLVIMTTGSVELWQNSTKGTVANRTININDLPVVLWVEATAASQSVRDISIKAVMDGDVKDEVKITAVWVNFVRKYKTKASTGLENSSTLDLNIDAPGIVNLIENYLKDINGSRYGIGECALFHDEYMNGCGMYANFENKNAGYAPIILTEYEVLPMDLKDEPDMLGVKFDFARQITSNDDVITISGYDWQNSILSPDMTLNGDVEESNDDGDYTPGQEQIDEDLTPSSYNKIYSIDAPGFFYSAYYDPEDFTEKATYFKRELSFKEFVRVSFITQPGGDDGIQGSRCSYYVPWSAKYTVHRKSIDVSDKYESCNQRYAQVNTALSHSDVIRRVGTSTPTIDITLHNNATNANYEFEYQASTTQWVLIRKNSSGTSIIGTFSYDSGQDTWILIDPSQVTIQIYNLPVLSDGDTFQFNVVRDTISNLFD